MARTVHDNRSTPAGTVLPLEYGASSALWKSETSCPVSGRLVRTADFGGTWLPIGRASVNEKGAREKNDGNEDVSMDDNEKIEADSDAESFAEEDWNDPEQSEVPKWTQPDLPITAGTKSGNLKQTGMRYNRYGDAFLIDKIHLDELGEKLKGMGELVADDEGQIINGSEHYPQEDYSTPEQETDLEQSEIETRENTNLRILEWMRDVKSKRDEEQSIQQFDVSAENHVKTKVHLFGWTATDRRSRYRQII